MQYFRRIEPGLSSQSRGEVRGEHQGRNTLFLLRGALSVASF